MAVRHEEIFLRAQQRTFSGLTKGSGTFFSYFSRLATVEANALANALSKFVLHKLLLLAAD